MRQNLSSETNTSMIHIPHLFGDHEILLDLRLVSQGVISPINEEFVELLACSPDPRLAALADE